MTVRNYQNQVQSSIPKRRLRQLIVNPPEPTQQRIPLRHVFEFSTTYSLSLPILHYSIINFNYFIVSTTAISSSWSDQLSNLIQPTPAYFNRIFKHIKNLVKPQLLSESGQRYRFKKVPNNNELNLTSEIITITLKFLFVLSFHNNSFSYLVMSSDDLSSQSENNILASDSEDQDLDSTIIDRTKLSRTTSLESSLNKISANLSQLEVEINKNKRSRSSDSPKGAKSESPIESNPGKRLKIAEKMLPLTSDVVKNNFHIVDIVSDEEAIEFLTVTQGNNIYTSVLKEIMKANDISKIHFEDSFNDRGKYRYICSNDETRDWLVAIIPTITPWANAKIKPVYQGAPPTLIKYIINVTLPTLEPGDIFTLMAAQNPNLDTTNWKCSHRSKADKGKQTWIVGVDENSIEVLKGIDFKPHVGSGRMKLIPKKWNGIDIAKCYTNQKSR